MSALHDTVDAAASTATAGEATRTVRVVSSILIGLGATVLMLLHTMWPTLQGQAPHPDGDRYLCQLAPGTLGPADTDAPRYWSYALFSWVPGDPPEYGCVAYPSSQVLILQGLQALTRMSGGEPGALDFRWGVALYAVFVGVMVGLFAYTLRTARWPRILLSAALLLVIGDMTFASYAAGPMGEVPGILGVVLVAVGAVYLGTRGARQWLGLALVLLGSALALTSKLQAITLVVPLLCFLVGTRLRGSREPARRRRSRRVLAAAAGHVVPALLGLGLIVPAAWMLDNNPTEFQAINPWETISVGILTQSADPGADLVEMGFPRSLEKYAGKTACDDGCAVQFDPAWIASKDKMTVSTVAKFLLRHPGYAVGMASVNARDFFAVRPTYLGSFEPGSGAPERQAFSPLTLLGMQLQPAGLPAILLTWAAIAVGAWLCRRRSHVGTWRRAFTNAALLMISFAVVQFVTAAYGEAIENTKHHIFGILATALAVVLVLSACFGTRSKGQTGPQDDAGTPATALPDEGTDEGAHEGAHEGADQAPSPSPTVAGAR